MTVTSYQPGTWQQSSLTILPEINRRLRRAFQHLDPESRDDLTKDGVVHCMLSYIRLFERCRAETATPAPRGPSTAQQNELRSNIRTIKRFPTKVRPLLFST
jgi:hypothetical protein